MDKKDIFQTPRGEDDVHAYHTPLESKVEEVLSPFQEYVHSQAVAGFLLLICAVIALIWASLPAFSHWYVQLVNFNFGFFVGDLAIEKSLKFWTNDVLLTLFFFIVGLEIKREFLVGELRDTSKSLFVVFSALGGVLVPAVLFSLFNYGTANSHGWGIPIATDTAFALGVLTLFRSKLPRGLFPYVAALAIIDDIVAILVIAIFYTVDLDASMLIYAALAGALLIFFNVAGFRRSLPYILAGIMLWYFIEAAHVHGTVAGIIVAFLVPARPRRGPNKFIQRVNELLEFFEKRKNQNPLILEDDAQHAVVEEVKEIAIEATTPLQRWERQLDMPISIIILPLFALVNAGIPVSIGLIDDLFTHSVSLGIMFGLLLGKPLGVISCSYLALKLGLGKLPAETNYRHIISVAILTGVGFTMSLFMANLTFSQTSHELLMAKAAILLSSIVCILLGIISILFIKRPQTD